MVSRRDRITRCLLHIPVGIFTVGAGYAHWVLALVFFGSFIAYEITEDWRLKDRAYIDIYGYLWGLALGIVGLLIFKGV